jgi:hypothetical protein
MYRRSTASLAAAAILSFWLVGCSDDADPGDNNNATGDAAVDAQPDTGPQALALDLGEIVTVDASATGTAEVTLLTEGGDEEFLILAQSRDDQLNIIRPFTVGLPQQRSRRTITPAITPNERLGRWGCLSGGGQVDLARVVDGLRGLPVPRGQVDRPVPRPVPPPNVGEMVDFEINSNAGLVTVATEVLLVSASLVVVLDRDTDPTLELDATMLADIASAFEDIVLPRERIFFGVESDVNDDNHITVLFSPLVNESGATAYVNPYDLVTDPAARPAGVAANDQELLYVTPPQLLPPHMGTVNGIVETLAHEFQHAIYFYRKYQLNDTVGDPESSYITEGLSALAQDITGYQAGNFFVAKAGLDEIDDISINDLVASQGGYYNDRDGALRGGAYNLIRYLYDQAGGDVLLANGDIDLDNSPGVAWLRDLVDSPELGVANIETAAGQPLTDVATDWYTAQMVDDRTDAQNHPLNTDPLYNYLPTATDPLTGRTRGTSMIESFMDMVHKTGPRILDFDQADGWIRPGGAEYLRLTATQSPTTTFTLAADPDNVNLRLVIFRTR